MSDTELLPKSNMEPVRRLEVFTGSGRRRSWRAEQKAAIVGETYESGETVSAVARRHGLTPQQLFSWRRQMQGESGNSGAAFAPVIVDAAQRGAAMLVPPVIEIVIGAATIRIPSGIDAATVQMVLCAVRAAI